jgi:hypothetical protein
MVSAEAPRSYHTASGEPLMIVQVERAGESNSTAIDPAAVECWLENRGFRITQRSNIGNRLRWEDVEALFNVKEGVLAELGMTFTLSKTSPTRVVFWKCLVEQVCENWDFSLYASALGFPVCADQFLRALSSTPAWQDFHSRFNWPPI